ncbi:hypothetical protein ACQ4PT_030795 [Festuca glaucescens]
MLRAAGLVCSPWPRLALEEPQMWRHIDLREGDLWNWRERPRPPAGWKAMARAAVELSAGRCESFTGHVDADVLFHLANRHSAFAEGSVRRRLALHRRGITKKLPLLQRLTLWSGSLELLDATQSSPMFALWHKRIATRIRSCTIKDFRQPLCVLE